VATANDDTHLFLHAQKGPLIKSSKHVILDVSLDHRATRKHLHLAFYEAILSTVYPNSHWCPLPLETNGRQATDTLPRPPRPPRSPAAPPFLPEHVCYFGGVKDLFPQPFLQHIWRSLYITAFVSPIGLGNPLFAAPVQSIFSQPSRGSPFFEFCSFAFYFWNRRLV
jgi:hypothetical protein